ncbi:MAG: alpha/beta hydrolase [Coriobacteriia bacterium]|nr:alpha/beta hydrolase [Coriobacteriia bacterium]
MGRLSWEVAERLSLPRIYAMLKAGGRGNVAGLIEKSISFGDHPAQHVLTVRPERSSTGRPLVYFVHGGSWRYGSPEDFRAVGRFFAREGYATALGGYRLVPEHRFPAQRDDVLDGIAAVRRQEWFSAACNGEVILVGQSAGGQLAALAAFDEESREARGLGDLAVAGLLAVSGVLDFEVLCPGNSDCLLIEDLMGGREGWDSADPARFVHGGRRIPILCLHGSRDPLVPVTVSTSFVMRANGSEGDHAVFIADPTGHHSDMTRVLIGSSPSTPRMLQWMEDVSVASR